MEMGTVKWFCDRGFGFIASDQGGEIFAHASQIEDNALKTLWQGQRVTFEIVEESHCRQASHIQSV